MPASAVAAVARAEPTAAEYATQRCPRCGPCCFRCAWTELPYWSIALFSSEPFRRCDIAAPGDWVAKYRQLITNLSPPWMAGCRSTSLRLLMRHRAQLL